MLLLKTFTLKSPVGVHIAKRTPPHKNPGNDPAHSIPTYLNDLNGDAIGYKTHFSVFFVLMKGELDFLLKCPFQYKVSFSLTHFKNVYSSSSVKNCVKMSAANHCSLVLSLYLISYLPSLFSLHSSSCSLHLHMHSFIFITSLPPPSIPLSPSLSYVCGHDCCIVNWLVFHLLYCVRTFPNL